jgi:hypothetical protein
MSHPVYRNISNIIGKVTDYMKFLSDWMKTFGQKVDPIITKLAADAQQQNNRDAQHVALGGNLEEDPGFGNFFST